MENSVTLITGAGSGIGAALARRLAARQGARLLLHTGSGRDKAERLAAELREKGAGVWTAVESFRAPARAEGVAAAAVSSWDRIDRIAHVAGFADRRQIGALDAAGFEASLAANATAFFHLVTAALPYLR